LGHDGLTVGWLAAIALGIVLLLSGALKVAGWRTWRAQSARLGVPRVVAVAVPILELVLGALLVVDLGRRVAAIVAAGVLVAFSIVLARVLLRHDKVPCACFGALSRREVGPGALVRNGVLIALAIVAAAVR
jgi:hypothetical protein